MRTGWTGTLVRVHGLHHGENAAIFPSDTFLQTPMWGRQVLQGLASRDSRETSDEEEEEKHTWPCNKENPPIANDIRLSHRKLSYY